MAREITLTTNIWQGHFDVKAGGHVDGAVTSEIRNRSLASGSDKNGSLGIREGIQPPSICVVPMAYCSMSGQA